MFRSCLTVRRSTKRAVRKGGNSLFLLLHLKSNFPENEIVKVSRRVHVRARRANPKNWDTDRMVTFQLARHLPIQPLMSSKHIPGEEGVKARIEAEANLEKAHQRREELDARWSLAFRGINR